MIHLILKLILKFEVKKLGMKKKQKIEDIDFVKLTFWISSRFHHEPTGIPNIFHVFL